MLPECTVWFPQACRRLPARTVVTNRSADAPTPVFCTVHPATATPLHLLHPFESFGLLEISALRTSLRQLCFGSTSSTA